ncbi:electron transfer flavoprotein subunit alpha/FixB family protein [Turneriella parva]|uniref:Electron transfer flavoprotein subunit alpha n=1 Tax=Turneriella parva (strain ATCC BAA-1111 / DSM 21527 / NCTC 11395 / H) TaxID=869212 RepID=I4B7A9_TURPD|nr:electron transfer flavoprotein subunit alpha/FixB family protein [Turneriella parva]AFM13166.1 electron transfer flavoprotein alpha subunit apoprotein [Turneriella parva DSM 21527]
MAKILAVGEIAGGVLRKASRETTSVGKKLGSVSTVLIGSGAAAGAAEVAKHGADTVYVGEIATYNGEAYAKAIADLVKAKGYEVVILPHSWIGRDISARIATLLNTGVISDAVDISMDGDRVKIRKPVYSGKAFVSLKVKASPQVVTIRPNAHPIAESAGAGAVENITVDAGAAKAKQVKFEAKSGSRVSLTEADIVVSGGRGIKGPENFPLIEQLADILGAGVGATRAVVDAGWCDHTLQIGQTGQTVSPKLYVAVGISGAIQHMAGMGSSKYIVAINKDADAPIFKVSTYGIVDDLFNVLPPLKEELKAALGK